MNPKSPSTLVWASVITSMIGMLVLSPAAGFMLYVVAIILSIVPLVSGTKVTRIAAAVAFIISLALASRAILRLTKSMTLIENAQKSGLLKYPSNQIYNSSRRNKFGLIRPIYHFLNKILMIIG